VTLRSAQGMPARALVLAAHGSRRDPAANALVRRLAEAVRARRLFDEVAVAFHQGEPRFETVLDELTADEVSVVPLLTRGFDTRPARSFIALIGKTPPPGRRFGRAVNSPAAAH